MKVDAYRSKAKPSYGLVVPAGVDISKFDGEVGKAVNVLTPLEIAKTGELESLFVGDLLKHLQTQIAEKGAGLVKTEVRFSEVTSL